MTRFRLGWKRPHVHLFAPRFAAAAHVLAALPSKVDLSQPQLPAPFTPPLNQQDLGACGPNTLAKLLLYDQEEPGQPGDTPSRLFLYWNTRAAEGTVFSDSGVSNADMIRAVSQYGWCDESLWPYTVGKYQVKPSQACYDQAASRKVTDWLQVPVDLQQMKACLAGGAGVKGRPFILGFTVYESMMSDAVAKSGVVPMPTPSDGAPVGGHDVIAMGFDDSTGLIKFQNHWYNEDGTPWGDGGYGYLPYGYFAPSLQLVDDCWTRPTPGAVPAPAPNPPQPIPPAPPGPPAPTTITIQLPAIPAGTWILTKVA